MCKEKQQKQRRDVVDGSDKVWWVSIEINQFVPNNKHGGAKKQNLSWNNIKKKHGPEKVLMNFFVLNLWFDDGGTDKVLFIFLLMKLKQNCYFRMSNVIFDAFGMSFSLIKKSS